MRAVLAEFEMKRTVGAHKSLLKVAYQRYCQSSRFVSVIFTSSLAFIRVVF